jgi:hypothetical protein
MNVVIIPSLSGCGSDVVRLDRYSIRVFGWVRKMLQICWGVFKDKEALECC